jgi:hypothetical protein
MAFAGRDGLDGFNRMEARPETWGRVSDPAISSALEGPSSMAIVICRLCGRRNILEELAARGHTCERCGQAMPRHDAPQKGPSADSGGGPSDGHPQRVMAPSEGAYRPACLGPAPDALDPPRVGPEGLAQPTPKQEQTGSGPSAPLTLRPRAEAAEQGTRSEASLGGKQGPGPSPATGDELFPLPCPQCGQATCSLKLYHVLNVLFVLVAFYFEGERHVACPRCMRRTLALHGLFWLLPANLLWPVFVLIPNAVHLLMTFRKGHSANVRDTFRR